MKELLKFLLLLLVIWVIPIYLIITYWCKQDTSLQFKVMFICLQSSFVMIFTTALIAILVRLFDDGGKQ